MIVEVAKIIGGLALDWFKNKREEKQAKHEAKMKVIANQATWEQTAQENSGASWRDEWWTVILSFPLVACFIPPLVPYVKEGFSVLQTVPDWYKIFTAASVGSAFGYKAIINVWKKKGG